MAESLPPIDADEMPALAADVRTEPDPVGDDEDPLAGFSKGKRRLAHRVLRDREFTAPPLRSWLRDIAGSALLVLGVLYTVGCVTKYGQLREAGLNPDEVIQILPLQQLLLLGISTSVPLVLSVLLSAIFTAVSISLLFNMQAEPPLEVSATFASHVNRIDRRSRIWFLGATPALGILTLAVAPTLHVVIAQVGAGLIMGLALRRVLSIFLALGLAAALMTGGLSLQRIQHADPLPGAVLTLKDPAGQVAGVFVAHADSTWFVAQRGGRLRAIQDDRVRRADVVTPKAEKDRRLFRALR